MTEYAVNFELTCIGTVYIEADDEGLALDMARTCETLNDLENIGSYCDYETEIEVEEVYEA